MGLEVQRPDRPDSSYSTSTDAGCRYCIISDLWGHLMNFDRQIRGTCRSSALIALSAAAAISGCAYTRPIDGSDKAEAGSAYVYGRFSIDAPQNFLTMGLSMSCSDGSNYIMRFDRKDPVQAFRVKPAECQVREIVYSTSFDQVKTRKPIDLKHLGTLNIAPQAAYYIGDYFAVATQNSYTSGNTTTTNYNWQISRVRFDYGVTTADLNKKYPGLAGLTKRDTTRR